MDIRMASLPGCGLGGGGGGGGGGSGDRSNGYSMKKNTHHPIGPQVTLISGQPPVLDMTGCKPSSSRPTSGICGSTRRVGGNLWTSIRNMYNSIRSGPSLTWVNPGMIPEFHTAPTQPQYSMADASYVNQNQPLWYQATPGSQFGYEDPLQALSCPFSGTLPPYSSNLPPGNIYSFKKSSQPLNPEAKEWVPSGYKDNSDIKSSMPSCFTATLDKNVHPKAATGDVAVDFTEITESEIEEARNISNTEEPKKTQDSFVGESSNKQFLHMKAKMPWSCIKSQKSNTVSESCINLEVSSDASFSEVLDPSSERLEISDLDKTECTTKDQENSSPSYASITRKSPEPTVKPKVMVVCEGNNVTSSECVKQPLPKIFLKDKVYPKEKAPLVMENKKRDPLPFKTASKFQKKSSKKFLRDLKELSPVKSDSSFSGSECSLESNSGIISRLCISSSPVILGIPGNEFTKEKTENVRSQRSLSESSASSHVRTASESTVGSVESIDIEFGEDCDTLENKRDDNDLVADRCQSRSSVEGKYVNSIVAHILGFDESDSEDTDDDSDDSDWDTVQECISPDVDDSWETFGIRIPLITKSSPCFELCNNNASILENVCDNVCYNSSLKEINNKWDEEVCRDVTDASPCKVSFGEVIVHPMVAWSFAYRNARKGPWEQYARDRSRFNNRILSLDSVISPVLADDHRKAMYCKIHEL